MAKQSTNRVWRRAPKETSRFKLDITQEDIMADLLWPALNHPNH